MISDYTAHSVCLPAFEGPLDLLLHLIRVNEVDIHDIPIAEITRQYDEYLQLMQELDLHVAGEYLLMASTLLHIKSKTLLPRPPEGEEAPEEDPRAGLVQQLLEYEKVSAAAEHLRELESSREDVYFRPGDPLAEYEGESLFSVSLFDLLGALKNALERFEAGRAIEIGREEFSIEDKESWILSALADGKAKPFQELLGSLTSRAERVVAFLALLELIRLRKVLAAQRRPAGEILLLLRRESSEEPFGPGGDIPGDPLEESHA